jgi:hypothetical protein
MAHTILESKAGSGLLPPQRRPIHQIVKAVATENYHREPGCSDLLLFLVAVESGQARPTHLDYS